MNKKIFRKALSNTKPYVQGKSAEDVKREFGLDRIEKLASNENQYGPSPKAVEAMKEELSDVNFYPESIPVELREALAEKLNVSPDMIAMGNAGENLLRLIAMTFIEEGDESIVLDPSFAIYDSSTAIMGGKTVKVPIENNGFNIDKIIDSITDRTKVIWLCTPNNPTGHIATQEELDKLVDALPDDVVLVLDEAYYEYACAFDDYSRDNVEFLKKKDNVILLRTFSKTYGLAGLRIGYVISSPEIAVMINSVKLTFEVNRPAQAAALAALGDTEYLDMVVASNKAELDFLKEYFDEKGFDYYPTYTNFIWVDLKQDSKLIFDALQRKGVIIRPGFLWGWDTWIRLSTGTHEQMEFFIEKLEEVLAEL